MEAETSVAMSNVTQKRVEMSNWLRRSANILANRSDMQGYNRGIVATAGSPYVALTLSSAARNVLPRLVGSNRSSAG
jgi:hypothetical protein